MHTLTVSALVQLHIDCICLDTPSFASRRQLLERYHGTSSSLGLRLLPTPSKPSSLDTSELLSQYLVQKGVVTVHAMRAQGHPTSSFSSAFKSLNAAKPGID